MTVTASSTYIHGSLQQPHGWLGVCLLPLEVLVNLLQKEAARVEDFLLQKAEQGCSAAGHVCNATLQLVLFDLLELSSASGSEPVSEMAGSGWIRLHQCAVGSSSHRQTGTFT